MARGGYRPGAGRKKKGAPDVSVKQAMTPDIVVEANAHGLTPLEYALKVMNNAEADQARRDRMCAVAMPFCHPRKEPAEAGKKEQKEAAAKDAQRGKYAPPAAPKLVVVNG